MRDLTYRQLQEAEEAAQAKFPGQTIGDDFGSPSFRVSLLEKLVGDVGTACDGGVHVPTLRRELSQLAVAATMWLDVLPEVEVTH